MSPIYWQCRDRRFEIGRRPLVMGIVNVTPDSFSDGGSCANASAAVARGLELAAEGADILDIGGESTRPGARPVTLAEELARVFPVVSELAERTSVAISVDTSKAELARRCLDAGAAIVNDITGLRGDAEMAAVVADHRAGVVVMHMQGSPPTMQDDPHYADVVAEVGDFFDGRLHSLAAAGIPPAAMCLDPGIGFGKTLAHNLDLLANLAAFNRFERPICLGVSRKGFIGQICGRPVEGRMPGSLAVVCFAAARGAAHVIRTHDVAATRDAVLLLDAIDRSRR